MALLPAVSAAGGDDPVAYEAGDASLADDAVAEAVAGLEDGEGVHGAAGAEGAAVDVGDLRAQHEGHRREVDPYEQGHERSQGAVDEVELTHVDEEPAEGEAD